MATRANSSEAQVRQRAHDLKLRGMKLIEQADQMLALAERQGDSSNGGLIDAAFLFDQGGDGWFTLAEASYISRRRRERFFPATLFGEPAWDILLDLYMQNRKRVPVSISSACLAGGTAPTTGLRWLSVLEDHGLVERERNTSDGRMSWIRLSPKGLEHMQAYLADILNQSDDWRRGVSSDATEERLLAHAG